MIYIKAKEIIFYNKNGQYHRIDEPAYIQENFQAWYQNGIRHREDGPAVIWNDWKEWYQNGKHHRIGGPSVIWEDCQKWYIKGYEYNELEYYNKLKEMGLG